MLSEIAVVKNKLFALANSRGIHFINPTSPFFIPILALALSDLTFSYFFPQSVSVYCCNVECLLICLPIIPQHIFPLLPGLYIKAVVTGRLTSLNFEDDTAKKNTA